MCVFDWLINWQIDWLIDWLIDWQIDWLSDWLVKSNQMSPCYFIQSSICFWLFDLFWFLSSFCDYSWWELVSLFGGSILVWVLVMFSVFVGSVLPPRSHKSVLPGRMSARLMTAESAKTMHIWPGSVKGIREEIRGMSAVMRAEFKDSDEPSTMYVKYITHVFNTQLLLTLAFDRSLDPLINWLKDWPAEMEIVQPFGRSIDWFVMQFNRSLLCLIDWLAFLHRMIDWLKGLFFSPEPEVLVCVQNGDLWYRGRVLSVDYDGTCSVLFVDFGRVGTTSFPSVRPLFDRVAAHPALALRCVEVEAQALYCRRPVGKWEAMNEIARELLKPLIGQEVHVHVKDFCPAVQEPPHGSDDDELMVVLHAPGLNEYAAAIVTAWHQLN